MSESHGGAHGGDKGSEKITLPKLAKMIAQVLFTLVIIKGIVSSSEEKGHH